MDAEAGWGFKEDGRRTRTVGGVTWVAGTTNGGRSFYVWKDGATVKRLGGNVRPFRSLEKALEHANSLIGV